MFAFKVIWFLRNKTDNGTTNNIFVWIIRLFRGKKVFFNYHEVKNLKMLCVGLKKKCIQ